MKATRAITTTILLAGATHLYSQGAISMNDYVGGGALVQVFQAQPLANSPVLVVDGAYSGYEEMGNPANSFLSNPGTAVYANTPSSIGTGFDFGLLGAPGTTATSYSQLTLEPGSIGTTWSSTAPLNPVNNTKGVWNSMAVTMIPTTAPVDTVALAVWQNNGAAGAANTLAEAQTDGYAWGVSAIVTADVTLGAGAPKNLPATLTSFSMIDPVPEPGTMVLAAIGGLVLWRSRRAKVVLNNRCPDFARGLDKSAGRYHHRPP